MEIRPDRSQGRLHALRDCAVEIRRLVEEAYRSDPASLPAGTQFTAYVDRGNLTETWEVAEVNGTLASVRVRLIEVVPEMSAA